MSITSKPFGKLLFGEKVTCYKLDNSNGLAAEILDYGGIIKNLYFKNKNGDFIDIVLGKDTLSGYDENPNYMGGIIGRNTNIISNAKVKIGRRTFALRKNFGYHNLNGCDFHKKLWNVQTDDNPDEPSITLFTTSHDKEGGFPGEVSVMVTYTLTKDNTLKIEYTAAGSSDTIVNLTNHSYFNLSGHNADIKDHLLQLDCSFYINNIDGIPTGEILLTKDSAFDYKTEKSLENLPECYNQGFVADGVNTRRIGSLYSQDSGINMEIFTNSPVIGLKTPDIPEDDGKGGVSYTSLSGLAVMPQLFPDALRFNHFPTSILEMGKNFNYMTEYKFTIK